MLDSAMTSRPARNFVAQSYSYVAVAEFARSLTIIQFTRLCWMDYPIAGRRGARSDRSLYWWLAIENRQVGTASFVRECSYHRRQETLGQTTDASDEDDQNPKRAEGTRPPKLKLGQQFHLHQNPSCVPALGPRSRFNVLGQLFGQLADSDSSRSFPSMRLRGESSGSTNRASIQASSQPNWLYF